MKSFFQFLTEAGTSQAATQAAKLNLKSDGHGSWFDSRGNMVAVTDKGKLKFTKKKIKPQQEGPVKQMAQRRADDDLAGAPLQKQPETKPKKAEAEPEDGGASTGEPITVAFGRFNPPTVGHGKLLAAAKKAAAGGDLKIYPSRTHDNKKNPLDPDMKISYMKKMFPDYEEQIINDPEMRSIFDVLTTANEDGYTNINIIVGSDRQAEFENLAQKYNGELYNFDLIRVISAGVRDADADGVEGMSASKMRKSVADDDYESFRKGTPKELDDGDTTALFNAVRTGMKIKKGYDAKAEAKAKEDKIRARIPNEKKIKASAASYPKAKNFDKVKESYNLWEIAPSLDQRGLREQYVRKKIFNIGDLVENLNTGLVGRIIRRGTNYLICVTEQENMFKSWIRDVMEATKKSKKVKPASETGIYGVSGDKRGVGTASNREYAQSMVPGQGTISNFNIEEFINKYRKKK